MLGHDPKRWTFGILQFHRSDTLRRLSFWIVAVCVYTAIIVWLETAYWQIGKDSHVRNISTLHTLVGFAISFILVFRTNTAYERWWEGRRLWGSLMNNSRNLAMKLSAILPKDHAQRAFFRETIPAYAAVLSQHLRNNDTRIELFDNLSPKVQETLDVKRHLPNQIAAMLYQAVENLRREGTINEQQVLFMAPELQAFTDICGGCERIRNTPIPYSYSAFIKKFVTIYVATLPFGHAFTLGYYAVPIVGFMFYVLASLELIAEEIEEPFGDDANDLPIGKMVHNLRQHIDELI